MLEITTMPNKLSCWLTMWRRLRSSRAAAGRAAMILALLTFTGAVGQEPQSAAPSLTEAEALMKEGKYEEARSALHDFQYRIYKAQEAGELTDVQAQELQERTHALIERAEIALGCTVLRLEQGTYTARATEIEPNAGGLAMVLEFLDITADYDTLMGDSGMAFVWQAEALHKKGGKVEKFLKANWPFSFVTRVEFLSQTVGRRLNLEYLPDYACGPASLRAFNYEHVLPAIEAEVKAGRPVLGLDSSSMVVSGYKRASDGILDCFFVHWPGPGADRLSEFQEYLVGVVAAGEPVPQRDRKEADRLAIQHAVSLGRETLFNRVSFPEAAGADGDSGCIPTPEDVVPSRTYYTGRESFAVWRDSIKDETSQAYEDRGYAYRNLAILRRSAPVYLRAMALRHPQDVATALNQAVDFYDLVLKELPDLTHYEPAQPSEETRQEVADRISRIAELEAKAITSLNDAEASMP